MTPALLMVLVMTHQKLCLPPPSCTELLPSLSLSVNEPLLLMYNLPGFSWKSTGSRWQI